MVTATFYASGDSLLGTTTTIAGRPIFAIATCGDAVITRMVVNHYSFAGNVFFAR